MRKLILFSICCLGFVSAYGQQDVVQKYYDTKKQGFNDTASTAISADSKKNFWDFLGTFGNVVNTTSNGISLNPTLNTLGLKGRAAENTQLNFTPVAKGTNILKYDSLSFGFTIAIINNYSKKQWESFKTNPIIQRYMTLSNLLPLATDVGKFRAAFPGSTRKFTPQENKSVDILFQKVSAGAITSVDLQDIPFEIKLYLMKMLATSNLPGDMAQEIRKDPKYAKFLNASKTNYKLVYDTLPINLTADDSSLIDGILIAEFSDVYTAISTYMKNLEQLNFAASSTANFVTHRMQGFYFAPNYTNYFGKSRTYSYTLKTIYSIENDSLKHNTNFTRQLLTSTASIDWLGPKWNPNTKLSALELKLAAEHDWVLAGQYEKEKKSALSPVLTATLNITDQFSLPLSFKYDTKKANLFGFISVQYAMGKGK